MQNCNQVCEGWEEEDDQAVGGKLGSRWQPREEFCKAQEDRVWQHRHQARSRKTAGMRKKETDMSSLDVSEGDRAFSNIPRKNLHVKGKKKWVPKPRQTVQHEGYGKLIIRENQSQRKGRVSDSTSTSEEEGFISDFKKWRGEYSKTKIQKEGGDGQGHGLDSRNPNQDFQEISFGRSPSLDGPLREFLENIEKEVGPTNPIGLQQVVSRSQSLEGPLKEYLDNIEQAFIRAKFRKGCYSQDTIQPMQTQPIQNTIVTNQHSPTESVSIVQETIESTDSEDSEAEKDKEGSEFKSISAIREKGEVESEPIMTKQRKSKKGKGSTSKLRRNHSGSSKYGAVIVFIHEHEIVVEAATMVFQGVVSVEIVEMKTIFEEFAMAVRLGQLPLCIESNALRVNLCNEVGSSNGDRDNIIHDIVLLLHSFCDVKLVHIPRVCNSVTHM
ncbi:hypothetical protein LWI29_036524 [Acer saccharum]|uniref:RNase H type-1 domain-containing protein n=1 Tax=Acer saccharum TaxID=4024 RepID=A0AA39S1T7_ACESA|nr:hypothetical protein LWI29_036524 [Acer saccharum]